MANTTAAIETNDPAGATTLLATTGNVTVAPTAEITTAVREITAAARTTLGSIVPTNPPATTILTTAGKALTTANPSTVNQNADEDSLPYLAVIIACSAAGAALVIAIIIAVCIIRKKRKQGGKYNPKDCENQAGVSNQWNHQNFDPPSPERLI